MTFRVREPFTTWVRCYCSRCRRASGAGHADNVAVSVRQFDWTQGEALVRRYHLEDARTFERWFCVQCGGPVPKILKDTALVIIPAGTLDDTSAAGPVMNIHWRSRAPWSCGAQGLPTYTEVPDHWNSLKLLPAARPDIDG